MKLPCLSENLVIVRAGRRSLHPAWVDGSAPANFDLLVTSYEEGVPSVRGERIAEIALPGWKVAGYATLFAEHPEIFTHYKRIALLDDDLLIGPAGLSQLFAIGEAHNLDLWQPSLTWDSHFSYACFLRNPGFTLRYVNFVEMMCPFFSSAHLQAVAHLFSLGQETGIDLVWGRVFDVPWFRSAVIDAVAVKHTRPVGSLKHVQGFARDETYDIRMAQVLDRFGASFHGPVCYAAIDRDGSLVSGRLRIALRSARVLSALGVTPMSKPLFLRLALAFLRHAAVRPLNMGQLDLQAETAPAATFTIDVSGGRAVDAR